MATFLRRGPLSRRHFLRGVTLGGAQVRIALPPLLAMFNSSGTAYGAAPVETRFVFWFNGNGIPEKYWIPTETGREYTMTPCLAPLAPYRNDIHVISGLDNSAARLPGPGNNDHYRSMSALVSGVPFTGRGAGGPSLDQWIARRIGENSRFRSLQVGVSSESMGESIQRNMSWAAADRPLPPEMIPAQLFDRLFGAREEGWIERKRSILDLVKADVPVLKAVVGKQDQLRLDEHLASIRDVERSITSLPPEYHRMDPPQSEGDLRDWPRIAKLQSDLLAHALASGQTRVASYMLTKCQGLARFPWLGLTTARHHDYTHVAGNVPGGSTPAGQRILRDICRWHVEEFANLVGKLKSIREGDGTLLDNTLLLYVHEHAEANPHKNSGHAVVVAGHAGGRLLTGTHTRVNGTLGDLYSTLAEASFGLDLTSYPTAESKLAGITV